MKLKLKSGLDRPLEVSWDYVYGIWRSNEYKLQHWIDYREKAGFKSWEDWRRSRIKRYKCKKLKWQLYEIVNPCIVVHFRGGLTKTWMKLFYGKKILPSFKEMIRDSDLMDFKNLSPFIENFPQSTTMIGLVAMGDIFVIEGMHRSAAIAVEAQEGRVIANHLFIALAEVSYTRLYILDHVNHSPYIIC